MKWRCEQCGFLVVGDGFCRRHQGKPMVRWTRGRQYAYWYLKRKASAGEDLDAFVIAVRDKPAVAKLWSGVTASLLKEVLDYARRWQLDDWDEGRFDRPVIRKGLFG